MKYSIVSNNYQQSIEIEKTISQSLQELNQWQKNDQNPDYVFVIGGDGTFLEAIFRYQLLIEKIIFIPIKFGGIGFYTNHNSSKDFFKLLPKIDQLKTYYEYSLLEVKYDDKLSYSINEIKVMNNIKPLKMDVYINDVFLETFRGTGLVFSTPSGSTGFIKSAGGSIIYPNLDLFEMHELFPVSTNKFRTLNAPIIFSKNEVIKLRLENPKDVFMSVDTNNVDFKFNELEFKLSNKKVKVLATNELNFDKTTILNDIFVLNDNTKN